MIKYCVDKWNKNKNLLEEKLRAEHSFDHYNYRRLVKMVVDYILNAGDEDFTWDSDNITEIDNGDYQGTLLFTIPRETYQPSEYDYLMTYVGYGSCCVCDPLESILDGEPEEQVKDLMALCKDILTNMTKPFNGGWRYNEDFAEIEWED